MHRIRRFLDDVAVHPHPAKYGAGVMLKKLGLSRLLLIRKSDFVLRFYPTSLSLALWSNPGARSGDEHIVRGCLRPGDTMVDVGANIGELALAGARAVGKGGRVIAIEPDAKVYRYLCGNIALNHAGNVQAVHCALGAAEGWASLHHSGGDDTTNAVSTEGEANVPLRRLDSITAELDRITLLKVDVEGYEKFVFQGGGATLSRTRFLYFESWDAHFAKFGYGFPEIYKLLGEQNFAIYRPHGQQLLGPLDAGYRSAACENLVALRDTREFLDRTGLVLQEPLVQQPVQAAPVDGGRD